MFSHRFETVTAANGQAVLAAVERIGHFDVALMDIVMPIESDELKLEDSSTTGLRLIKRMIKGGVCKRFVVVTVRWDLEEEIQDLQKDGAVLELLVKQHITSSGDIVDAVERVLAATVGEGGTE